MGREQQPADRRPGGRVARIYDMIRSAIADGRLPPGERLPSTRELAETEGCSRNTVATAYDLLASEGWVGTLTGAGTFVLARRTTSTEMPLQAWTPRLASWAQRLPIRTGLLEPGDARIDFRPGRSSRAGRESGVPLLRHAAARFAFDDRDSASAEDPAGNERLRDLIAVHLGRTRGTACSAGDVVLTTGTHQSLDLLARTLANDAGSVAIEDPGYPLVGLIFGANGFAIDPVPVDEHGIVVARIPERARIVYVTPTNQMPLGVRMSDERRRDLLAFASRVDALIIEDDYDGEIYGVGRHNETLKSLDREGRVVFLSSLSKYLTRRIRFGYAVLPGPIRDTFVRAKWLTDRQVSSAVQFSVEALFEGARFPQLMRRIERDCSLSFNELAHGIETRLANRLTVYSRKPGMHLTALAAPDLDLGALVRDARAAGIGLYELRAFLREPGVGGLVFGVAALTPAEVREGIEVVAEIARRQATPWW